MLPLVLLLLGIFLLAVGAGVLGSMLGLGGGMVIVPGLVLLFGVDVHWAIATSLVSVIATSAGSASRYARKGLLHLRLGFFLEVATVVGGLVGAVLTAAVLIGPVGTEVLLFLFAVVASSASFLLLRDLRRGGVAEQPRDPLADRWRLHATLPADGPSPSRAFRVGHVREGLSLSFVAGLSSGLLGIGGGLYKVPAMTAVMGVPMKMASATSSLMIGVTAASGALVFLLHGEVAPLITAPVAVGTLAGTQVGTHVHAVASSRALRIIFLVAILAAVALMILRGLGVTSA
ncbi:MAG: sulfite exporter TauE/SafE family protein [Euryarchaeota archaeon]|nr:sulfite exporter TauE/SafE family protein [Euryarchaeota archaeon]MDE1835426.1 sulfite exporter TauE/SafE family protein [Euryarchaeota archaeon]MDE1879562.1 sulfite exporter TauE/SafE family protein [Euryarchaeota archaeon]MDE2046077.1 sulfite exporter TauE/SafE family protein [Thermoplasmata archaeon]